jgi:hypothetical protein
MEDELILTFRDNGRILVKPRHRATDEELRRAEWIDRAVTAALQPQDDQAEAWLRRRALQDTDRLVADVQAGRRPLAEALRRLDAYRQQHDAAELVASLFGQVLDLAEDYPEAETVREVIRLAYEDGVFDLALADPLLADRFEQVVESERAAGGEEQEVVARVLARFAADSQLGERLGRALLLPAIEREIEAMDRETAAGTGRGPVREGSDEPS